MTRWTRMAMQLRRWLPAGKEQFRSDTAEELRLHIDELTEENVRAGMTPEEARRAAVLRFGNVGALSDSCQPKRRVFRFEQLTKDLRFGMRVLGKTPGFTIVAILTLAVGIGGTTAIFSVVNRVLLQPLPLSEPDRIVVLWSMWKDNRGSVSAGNFVDWQEQSRSMERMAAVQVTSFTLENVDNPERLVGLRATASFFDVFGVPPLLGRTFTEAEDQPGKDGVVVLSEPLWRGRFQSDPGIIGRDLRLRGRLYTVIGIMPASFDLLRNGQFLVPIAFDAERKTMHDEHYLFVVGRLKSGATLRQAQTEMDAIAKVQQERFPRENRDLGKREIRVEQLEEVILSDLRPALYMLLGAVGFVLLIVCANIGTLQLARARTRRKEIAVRTALGASPLRIVRQLLGENLLLSLFGGLAGLFFAGLILRLIVSRAPDNIPRIKDASLDGWALGFAVVIVVVTAVLSGGWAAARARKTDPGSELGSGRTSGNSEVRDRLRGAIMVTEVSLAIMLLVGAGLLIRSAIAVNRTDLGFDPSRLLVGRVTLPETYYTGPERTKAAFRQIELAARTIPGVERAALVDRTPMSGGSNNGLIRGGRGFESLVQSDFHLVTPGYFATARIPLKLGRTFTESDVDGALKVIVINQTLAKLMFPDENPIGKRIDCCDRTSKTVVGVVGDVRGHGITENLGPEFYLPVEQAPTDAWRWISGTMEILLRTSNDPSGATSDMRAAVRQIDPSVPVYMINSMEERIGNTQDARRLTTLLLASFAALALFLASIGVYGVLSYSVTQRTQELGIRMALGANRSQVVCLVVGHGLRLVMLGTTIGILAALAVARLLTSFLFKVTPTDAVSFTVAPAVLVAVALLASYIPAARAMRIDPVVALRHD